MAVKHSFSELMENIQSSHVKEEKKQQHRIKNVLRIITDLILRPREMDSELKSV